MSPARGLLARDRDTGRSHVIAARPSGGYTKLSSHAGSQSQVTVRVSGSVSAASVFLSLRAEAAAVTVDDDAITLIGAAATVTVTAGVTLRLSAAAHTASEMVTLPVRWLRRCSKLRRWRRPGPGLTRSSPQAQPSEPETTGTGTMTSWSPAPGRPSR